MSEGLGGEEASQEGARARCDDDQKEGNRAAHAHTLTYTRHRTHAHANFAKEKGKGGNLIRRRAIEQERRSQTE